MKPVNELKLILLMRGTNLVRTHIDAFYEVTDNAPFNAQVCTRNKIVEDLENVRR